MEERSILFDNVRVSRCHVNLQMCVTGRGTAVFNTISRLFAAVYAALFSFSCVSQITRSLIMVTLCLCDRLLAI